MTHTLENQAHRYEARLSSHVDELLRLDALLMELLSAWGVAESLQSGVVVAVTEAVSNAIVHGNRQDPHKQVQLIIEREPQIDALRVIVEDEGMGFDPQSIPDPTREDRLLVESGRGIFLMRAFADEVIYAKGGRCVELRFRLA
jgi:serine/threonine-protein kinase RsbW